MKKFTKVCLIICAVLVGLGLLLCIIGTSLGFGFRQIGRMAKAGAFRFGWDETVDIGDIEIGAIDAGDIDTGDVDNSNSDWSQESEEWSAAQVEKLDIQFDFGTLLIEPSDSEKIEAEVEYRSAWNSYSRTISFRQEGSTLKIGDTVDKKILRLFTHGKKDAVLTVRIPEGTVFREVEMDIGAADVYLNTGINGDKMDITLGAGEMQNGTDTAAVLKAEELDLEIGAGHMALDGILARKLSVECGAGQMEITGIDAKTSDVECGVGQITLSMAGTQEDYNYQVDCGIGQVLVGDSSYSGLGRSQKIQNGGEKSMDIDCGIGEIVISFED